MTIKWAIIYKTHQKFVYRLVNLPKVCAQDPKCHITIFLHFLHLTFNPSHTHAPPHLIKTLRTMIDWF